MDRETLVQSITKTLESLETVTNFAFVLALAAALVGLFQHADIEFLGVKFRRGHAGRVVSVVYLVIAGYVLTLFWTLHELVGHVAADKDTYALKAVTELCLNKWPMNPFSSFGFVDRFVALNHVGSVLGTLTYFLAAISVCALFSYRRSVVIVTVLALIAFLAHTDLLVRAIFEDFHSVSQGLMALRKMDTAMYNSLSLSSMGTMMVLVWTTAAGFVLMALAGMVVVKARRPA